jgi:putative two-component system response regulator
VLAQHIAAKTNREHPLEPGYAHMIYLTSPLHDIGKVAIPDHVLLKPGRLSDHEFEIMKTHAALGAQTLDAAVKEHPDASFLRMAREIAATHHERWDGTGYPNGLKGEQIPLCGRVVALADVYDALTSKRVYKGAFSHDIAKAIILKDAGTHFAPEIVEAFLAVETSFNEIRERYRDDAIPLAA